MTDQTLRERIADVVADGRRYSYLNRRQRLVVDAIERLVNERVAEAFRDGHQKGQKYPNLAPGFFERD